MSAFCPNVVERDDWPEENRFRELMIGFKQAMLATGKSLGTVRIRLHHIEHLHRRFPDLLSVGVDDLERTLAERWGEVGMASLRTEQSSWRAFYKFAQRKNLVIVDPAALLDPVKVPRSMGRIASDEAVMAGLETASRPVQAMVLLGRMGALRLEEIATLHMSHRQGTLLRVTGKGGHLRTVPINADLLRALLWLEEAQPHGYYFPSPLRPYRGQPVAHLSKTTVWRHISSAIGTNPHSLRHAAATAAYNGTKDMRGVQEFLGHASIATTEKYLHIAEDQIRAVAEATRFRDPHPSIITEAESILMGTQTLR
ncbi:tyrosine-type recombinase/integrase [Plantibacter sp. Mn2098]|uniref:tyrosine-type recombinase/integrase n=1 Tax=Plantibacter sp. Mn2098 TaxID=3395266 RepID=UPI003BCE1784